MGNPDFPDDDDELELEPIDPELLARERERAQAKTDNAFQQVQFDDVYEKSQDDPLIDMDAVRRFRFQTKHLLMLTAALAVLMTLFQLVENPCSGIAILMVAFLVGGWGYVFRREQVLRKEKERLRAEFEAGRMPHEVEPDDLAPVEPSAPRFQFRFTTKQLLLTTTGAAVAMGLLMLVPNQSTVALLLGIIAVLGLVIHAAGFEPPAIVVLAWWLLLVCYLLLTISIALFGDGDEASAQSVPVPRALTTPAAVAMLRPGDCLA